MRHRDRSVTAASATVLLCSCAAIAAGSARAQQVESIFIAGVSSEGYYLANGMSGRLDAALLADLRHERPITLGARIEVLKRDYALQTLAFANTAQLVAAGRQSSGARDQWYLPTFSWIIGCSADGQEVTINDEVVGQSPIDFSIEAGIAVFDEASEKMTLAIDTVTQSNKKRVVCGKYAPLPAPIQ